MFAIQSFLVKSFIFVQLRIKLEECIRKQEIQINGIKEERDNLLRLSDELKMDIRLKDDKMESLGNELQDTMRKVKESKF